MDLLNMANAENPQTTDSAPAGKGAYNVVLSSIGTGGASVITALKHVFPLPEQALAARLFQTPSLLLQNLSQDLATRASQALCSAGLEAEVRHQAEPFAPGDSDHEVALVIKDYGKMADVLQSVCALLGVGPAQARDILCASPSVLIGRISKNTVDALSRRFAPLGVELDVAQPAKSLYDAFLGECSATDRARVLETLKSLGVTPAKRADDGGAPLLATELNHPIAQRLWEQLGRGTRLPLMLLNQSFARFDLRLDRATPSAELTEYLVRTAGMPERIVPKALSRLPLVTHGNIRFNELCGHLENLTRLKAEASGHLLAFQTFALHIDQVGDAEASAGLLRALAKMSPDEASAAITAKKVEGPLKNSQARWLQHELKQLGTVAKMVQR